MLCTFFRIFLFLLQSVVHWIRRFCREFWHVYLLFVEFFKRTHIILFVWMAFFSLHILLLISSTSSRGRDGKVWIGSHKSVKFQVKYEQEYRKKTRFKQYIESSIYDGHNVNALSFYAHKNASKTLYQHFNEYERHVYLNWLELDLMLLS